MRCGKQQGQPSVLAIQAIGGHRLSGLEDLPSLVSES